MFFSFHNETQFLGWALRSHLKRLTTSTAAELLAVAKAKQQLEKELEVKKLKARLTCLA